MSLFQKTLIACSAAGVFAVGSYVGVNGIKSMISDQIVAVVAKREAALDKASANAPAE